MPFIRSERATRLLGTLIEFLERRVYPNDALYYHQLEESRGQEPALVSELQRDARALDLWNLFMPGESHGGSGLSNVEYAPLCEAMGQVLWAPEVFNCAAPDTGNMELLAGYATPAQRERWLLPLLDARIRSAFCMTEPDVASSDPTQVRTSIQLCGDTCVIDGRKWFCSGALHPRCELLVVFGCTDREATRHARHTIALVPLDTPGVSVLRGLKVFGDAHLPGGHAEIDFRNVTVPRSAIVAGPGRGFEIAQARLGPGRIHHCMRLIGSAEAALALACRRVLTRRVSSGPLAEFDSVRKTLARCRLEIEQARLLTLAAAERIDAGGARNARLEIAAIKVVVPQMAVRVIDRAIQLHGAAGVSEETSLARLWSMARALRIADGPDEVHLDLMGKLELRRSSERSAIGP